MSSSRLTSRLTRKIRTLSIRYCAVSLIFFAAVFITVESRSANARDKQTSASKTEAQQDRGFNAVANIIEARCITCHNANNAKGGLSLHSLKRAMVGGDSGAVIKPGEPNGSLLFEYVGGSDAYMPPDEEPLTEVQVKAIKTWIAQGAAWPQNRELAESHLKDRSWWSLRPLKEPKVPEVVSQDASIANWSRNEIDDFVMTKLIANGLSPAPEADRRTLIRRVYFDLIGLPPTSQAIKDFITNESPDAYEKIVDKLLASPRYGERWARHWLDVVHYGDTHGYDKDKPRPNAWPYRDYVIRSLNADKPWSRFVREQIAGDVLYPNTRDGIEALGFISAGPWDFVGHAEVSEAKIDGKIARHLDRDDMVRSTTQAFLGLTVGCAQCHDHKFDPIPQKDYYKFHAVFAALDRADRAYDIDPETAKQRNSLRLAMAENNQKIATLRQTTSEKVAEELAILDASLHSIESGDLKQPDSAFGYHSQIEPTPDVTKWVQVDFGESIVVSKITLRPCKDDFNNIGAGFGFPIRFRIELSNDADFASPKKIITIADQSESDFKNPGLAAVQYSVDGDSARFVRVTATRLAPRKNDFVFALAELEVFDTKGVGLANGAKVSSLDSIEAPVRWQRSNLTDGVYPGDPASVEVLKEKRSQLILSAMTKRERERWRRLQSSLLENEKALAALPAQPKVYSGTVHTGNGTFVGTGANGGKPRSIELLQRGDVRTPRGPVQPGALSVLNLDRHFELDESHDESDRRAALAKWLTDVENPLPWRNIVNRVWQYHFGRGIVETPNDFGKMGGQPSHPALLDYLANHFRDHGQSLKDLHRLIVMSATYRQSSDSDRDKETKARSFDAENRLLWKMPRRKLEAEAIRDSVLMVSGKLNLKMFGPGFRDFVLKHPENSPHYEYHLHDPDDLKTHRRSIYRFIVRSQNQPFMSTLDCADPSMLVGRRNESLTPLQSLTMLNNGLMVAMAREFALKLKEEHAELSDQIHHGFYDAIGRKPTKSEHAMLLQLAKKHGLENACRLIFNLNEFSFVD